ncbi:uncharacterized protein LOC125188282 [Salvia hispanica]|uniref:uncharacterized protein LOC125188282 n=1 Tax=Salvia hispanica TaxID=49212 RepID=UPI0020094839|nr:uncharacterized protein LOC125188282 [Salvia hispanica]
MDNGQRQTKHLNSNIKNNVVQFLLKHSHDGVLARGAVMEAAETFEVSRKTVYRLWKAAKEQMQRGEPTSMEGKIKDTIMLTYYNLMKKRYYLLPDEDEPYRSCKFKRFITKVMFMCAVNRPHFGMDGQAIYDGKVGIFPFTEVLPTQRKSKNRPRGTMETKPIHSVTKVVMRDCLINQIIPAIKAKWPIWASKDIYIQQDNATPHITAMDPEFQSLQYEKPCSIVDELVGNVCSSFAELSPQTLNKVFLSLQACLTEILQCRDENGYKVPHINKDRLQRIVGLPKVIL